MAQLVCIAEGSLNPDVNELWDVVSIHDDDVKLDGSGYENAVIVKVANITAHDLQGVFSARQPEQKQAVRLEVTRKWTFLEEQDVWRDAVAGMWYEIHTRPKHAMSMATISEVERTQLAEVSTTATVRNTILAKARVKLTADTENQTEVVDLRE